MPRISPPPAILPMAIEPKPIVDCDFLFDGSIPVNFRVYPPGEADGLTGPGVMRCRSGHVVVALRMAGSASGRAAPRRDRAGRGGA